MIFSVAQSLSMMPAALCAAASPPRTISTQVPPGAGVSNPSDLVVGDSSPSPSPVGFYRLPEPVTEGTGMLAIAIKTLRSTPVDEDAVLRFSVGAETLEQIATFLSNELSVKAGETVTPVKSMETGLLSLNGLVTIDWMAAQKRWNAARKLDPTFKWDYSAEADLGALQRQILDNWHELVMNRSAQLEPRTLVLQAWESYADQQLSREIRIQIGLPTQNSTDVN